MKKPCKTLSKHPPKGEKSFYKFLLIISNVGSTYFEILKCQILFIYLFFKNEDFLEIFSKKSFRQIIEPFLLAFSSKNLFTLGFNLFPNLGCKKKNNTQ
jgi:hypothetical protein